MKTRHLSFLSLATAYAFLTTAPALIGCGGGGGTGTAGTSGGGSGGSSGGGTGGSGVVLDPMNLISDFEDLAAATVVMAGTPTRNGYWYTYNDASSTCVQTPKAMDTTMKYIGTAPPSGVPNAGMGSLSLHGSWSGCMTWGAGIGADLNQPAAPDGGTYSGPKVPYDVTQYKGVTFWAQVTGTADTALRIKFPMTDETKIIDGGSCDEAVVGMNKCSDDYGEQFNLPGNGSWKQFTIKWDDTGFHQEGWGAMFTWNPMHVTSIQIQSVDKTEPYDFWVDDIYFIK